MEGGTGVTGPAGGRGRTIALWGLFRRSHSTPRLRACDGSPNGVDRAERSADLKAGAGYLVPALADTGLGVVGHLSSVAVERAVPGAWWAGGILV